MTFFIVQAIYAMPIDGFNGAAIEIEEKVLTYLVCWNVHGRVNKHTCYWKGVFVLKVIYSLI
jgi:hypothetical protein